MKAIRKRRKTVPSDSQDVFTKPANGKTAGSYTTDHRWNVGGWATYPSQDELSISTKRPQPLEPPPPRQ
jgi:hypothetical protein